MSSSSTSKKEEQLARWQNEPKEAFEKGVWAALNLWDALILAVENGWAGNAGRDKLDDLYHDVLDLFEDGKVVC